MGITEWVIISGKGGTGKTSVTAALAAWVGTSVITDADVDGANLELVLRGERVQEGQFAGRPRAVIKPALCTACGRCADLCRFDAVIPSTPHPDGGMIMQIDAQSCEGCNLCVRFCPEGAIRLVPTDGGVWRQARTPWGDLFHARLEPGGENSGKLVALLRKQARQQAGAAGLDLMLTDGPPGSGCPVIATLTGAQQVLLVTEPTPSGQSDAERVLTLCRHFRRPVRLVINKFDLHPTRAAGMEAWARSLDLPVVGRLPYDQVVPEAIRQGVPVLSLPWSPWHEAFAAMARDLGLPGPGPTVAPRGTVGTVGAAPTAGGRGGPPAGPAGRPDAGPGPRPGAQGTTPDRVLIAIPLAGGRLSPHFGHAEEFAFLEANPVTGTILGRTRLSPPSHEPGVLPRWLADRSTQVVITGGLGGLANDLLGQTGIRVILGSPGRRPDDLVTDFLAGRLAAGTNACEHDDGSPAPAPASPHRQPPGGRHVP